MRHLADLRFSHLVVGVTDMDRALAFYQGLLGMDVVFDQPLSGQSFDQALGSASSHQGRAVGGLVGGVMLELLSIGKHGIRVNVVCPFANSDGVQYWQKTFPTITSERSATSH